MLDGVCAVKRTVGGEPNAVQCMRSLEHLNECQIWKTTDIFFKCQAPAACTTEYGRRKR